MAVILQNIFSMYKYLDQDLSDPRTKEYYILLNPFVLVSFGFLYHQAVTSWGPKYMEKREPFKLEKVMILYNIFQIFISAYIFIKGFATVWWSGYYNITCQPIIMEDTPIEREIIRLARLYYLVKILDLMDTVFFVLRKKHNQVSFLHVYHHILMLGAGFIGLKYAPGGHGSVLGTINTAVHTVMYFYYLITCINSEYKKNVWWKKHLTQMQIIQFAILLIHFGQALLRPSCTYSKWICLFAVPQNAFLLVIFSDFYIKTYVKNKTE